MSRSRYVSAVTITQTPVVWSYSFAFYLPRLGSNTRINSLCWRSWFQIAADFGQATRRIQTETDIWGEVCLVDRTAMDRILSEHWSGTPSASNLVAAVTREPKRVTLGQWVSGESGPRIVSVYGADKLECFMSETGRCGTDAALVGIAVDESPTAFPNGADLGLTVTEEP